MATSSSLPNIPAKALMTPLRLSLIHCLPWKQSFATLMMYYLG
jgi:hypothetical protein